MNTQEIANSSEKYLSEIPHLAGSEQDAPQHWLLQQNTSGILYLTLHCQQSNSNVLSKSVLMELKQILAQIKDLSVPGLIIQSDKPKIFIAGADIHEFTSFKTPEQAVEAIRYGQSIMDEISALNYPTLALIKGFCLGGGMELALACDHRLVMDSPHIKLGLPEVKLGIHPGFGGTLRSIHLLGLFKAMPLMMSGRLLSPYQAKKIGLVDDMIAERHIDSAALKWLSKTKKKNPQIWKNQCYQMPLVKSLIAFLIRFNLQKKVQEQHYPAPFAILKLWQDYGHNEKLMLQQEAKSVGQLMLGQSAKNLIRVFTLQERLKQLAKKGQHKIHHVHVVGAGAMGGDIAIWSALKGYRVSVYDRSETMMGKMQLRARKFFQQKLKQPHLIQEALDRLIPDFQNQGIKKADLLIEAILENVQAKQWVFKEAEQVSKPSCIFATNTSAIPLDEISSVLADPKRLVGLHFFNPVAAMPLVEVVSSKKTALKIRNAACHFTGSLGKLPLPVSSTPGFLVNRILMPYLIEAMVLFQEGMPAEKIDQSARLFGMPMGPLELADKVGLDICLSVAENLSKNMNMSVPQELKQMIQAGQLGHKSQHGFYRYQGGKAITRHYRLSPEEQEEITDRLLFRLFNEAVSCLNEKVVEDSDLLDAGVIFGTGFAPFRGGPLNYIYQQGIELMDNKLTRLSEHYGKRFKPVRGWHRLSPL